MLAELELDKAIPKKEYKKELDPLMIELQRLHRKIFEKRIPVLLIFEGWEGSGKGDCINRLLSRMDPRGTRVHTFFQPTEEERLRPFLWRFWQKLPSRGQVAVFEQSWYHWLLEERVERGLKRKGWRAGIQAVQELEHLLVSDGALILKFWLQITKKEQKKCFKAWEMEPAFAFRVDKAAQKQHKH